MSRVRAIITPDDLPPAPGDPRASWRCQVGAFTLSVRWTPTGYHWAAVKFGGVVASGDGAPSHESAISRALAAVQS